MNENFLGYNNFIWFTGVIEDRSDPEYLGRVRVRCFGFHTSDNNLLATADLPWAHCLLPTTSAGISGLGQSPSALVNGSVVLGYFRDGSDAQEPIVIGSLPGKPSTLAQSGGFNDPDTTYPKYKDEVDTNRLAVNLKEGATELSPHLSLTLRRNTRIIDVATADFNPIKAADESDIAGSDGDLFSQPSIPYSATYPFNKVLETESGHIKEYDDTAGSERIHERHRTGTSYEIDSTGTRVDIIKNEYYKFVSSKSQALIQGNSDTTINGRHKLFINKDGAEDNHYDIQIGENASINIQVDKGNINLVTVDGKINVNAGGDYNLKVAGNMTTTVQGNLLETIEGTKTSNTTAAVIHRGNTIDLNP